MPVCAKDCGAAQASVYSSVLYSTIIMATVWISRKARDDASTRGMTFDVLFSKVVIAKSRELCVGIITSKWDVLPVGSAVVNADEGVVVDL